jgi:hypothetical protein
MAKSKPGDEIVIAQIRGLRSELGRIREQKEKCNAREQAVLRMLKALEPLVEQPPKEAIAPDTGQVSVSGANGSHFQTGTGFREAVRKALRDHPKGLRSKEVFEVLKARGDLARNTGTTDPMLRVYNELYALKKAKQVAMRDGRYSIAMERANAVT